MTPENGIYIYMYARIDNACIPRSLRTRLGPLVVSINMRVGKFLLQLAASCYAAYLGGGNFAHALRASGLNSLTRRRPPSAMFAAGSRAAATSIHDVTETFIADQVLPIGRAEED